MQLANFGHVTATSGCGSALGLALTGLGHQMGRGCAGLLVICKCGYSCFYVKVNHSSPRATQNETVYNILCAESLEGRENKLTLSLKGTMELIN